MLDLAIDGQVPFGGVDGRIEEIFRDNVELIVGSDFGRESAHGLNGAIVGFWRRNDLALEVLHQLPYRGADRAAPLADEAIRGNSQQGDACDDEAALEQGAPRKTKAIPVVFVLTLCRFVLPSLLEKNDQPVLKGCEEQTEDEADNAQAHHAVLQADGGLRAKNARAG